MGPGQKAASALLSALCIASLGGCGDGLGECNEAALGGDPVMGRPYDGQQIVAGSCASGRCHSEGAMGDMRLGAPADLNFDVVAGSADENGKLAKAAGIVVDWAEDMWSEIDSGTMPPPAPAGTGELNGQQKEAVRNWLACGAPVIGAAQGAPSATWDSIWAAMGGDCVGCHSETTSAVGEGFVLGNLGDACASYENIVMTASVTQACTGETIVVPSNAGSSLLLNKLLATPGTCGSPMPLGAPMGLAGVKPELVDLVEQWIANGAPKPANCP